MNVRSISSATSAFAISWKHFKAVDFSSREKEKVELTSFFHINKKKKHLKRTKERKISIKKNFDRSSYESVKIEIKTNFTEKKISKQNKILIFEKNFECNTFVNQKHARHDIKYTKKRRLKQKFQSDKNRDKKKIKW